MKIVVLFLLAFILIACSDEKKVKPNEESKEEILIEQDDEKTEVNDTNLPLPVGEPSTHLQNQIYALTPNSAFNINVFIGGGGGKEK